MIRTIFSSLVVFAMAGCHATPPREKPGSYFGPTQSMAEVVAEINANNSALPTLFARHDFEANIVDRESKKGTFVNGDGVLLYKSPRGMRLYGGKPGTDIFEIGSNEERYWFALYPERSTMWWGWYRNLGKPCVDMRDLPVRPDMVLEVLGVGTIDTNFREPPAPVMRFNNDADSYMFVWNYPLGDRWAAQKEIWYDRASKLPRRVFLFNENGRVVVRAKLSNHAPVEMDGLPKENWPKVAQLYELFFPDTGSTMRINLTETAPDNKGVLARRGIVFPEKAKLDHFVQLDENCAADR
jgi:hypothetical protein